MHITMRRWRVIMLSWRRTQFERMVRPILLSVVLWKLIQEEYSHVQRIIKPRWSFTHVAVGKSSR